MDTESAANLTGKMLTAIRDHNGSGPIDIDVATFALVHCLAAVNTQLEVGKTRRGQRETAEYIKAQLKKVLPLYADGKINPFPKV